MLLLRRTRRRLISSLIFISREEYIIYWNKLKPGLQDILTKYKTIWPRSFLLVKPPILRCPWTLPSGLIRFDLKGLCVGIKYILFRDQKTLFGVSFLIGMLLAVIFQQVNVRNFKIGLWEGLTFILDNSRGTYFVWYILPPPHSPENHLLFLLLIHF